MAVVTSRGILSPVGMRVLELGCGPGANIPFFLSQGADYYAAEGSETIVVELQKKFPRTVMLHAQILRRTLFGKGRLT